nr:uncharacterized protein LOC106733107 [Pelodiscus sinensis]|eukprot:XP_025035579.1 uncharacterized protein LOC106733107 [Pelodiscus sinensis]
MLMKVVRASNSELLNSIVPLEIWIPSWLALLDWDSRTVEEHSMELTSQSVHRPIKQPSTSTEKATSPWCCRPWMTTMDNSLTFVWSGQAGHMMLGSSEIPTFTTGCRLEHSSHSKTLLLGMWRCQSALWPMWRTPWLMKPYTGHLNANREQFNAHLTQACLQVKCSFGRRKGRFRCLLTCLNTAERNIPEVVAACCVSHNLEESKGEAFLPG